MKVVFKREVLVSTRQFENQRVGIEIHSDEIDIAKFVPKHTVNDVIAESYNQLKTIGLEILTDEIVELKTGERVRKQLDERQRIKEYYKLS
jgi:hypothetical protein